MRWMISAVSKIICPHRIRLEIPNMKEYGNKLIPNRYPTSINKENPLISALNGAYMDNIVMESTFNAKKVNDAKITVDNSNAERGRVGSTSSANLQTGSSIKPAVDAIVHNNNGCKRNPLIVEDGVENANQTTAARLTNAKIKLEIPAYSANAPDRVAISTHCVMMVYTRTKCLRVGPDRSIDINLSKSNFTSDCWVYRWINGEADMI